MSHRTDRRGRSFALAALAALALAGVAGCSSDSDDAGPESADTAGSDASAGDFETVGDLSIDGDTICVFTNSIGTYGVSFSKESTSSYLSGELDGASTDDALSSLETLFVSSIDEPTVTRTDVGANATIIVTGTLLSGGPAGKAGTVVDGVAVIVEADGSDLASDAAGFEPIVANVLALATTN